VLARPARAAARRKISQLEEALEGTGGWPEDAARPEHAPPPGTPG